MAVVAMVVVVLVVVVVMVKILLEAGLVFSMAVKVLLIDAWTNMVVEPLSDA